VSEVSRYQDMLTRIPSKIRDYSIVRNTIFQFTVVIMKMAIIPANENNFGNNMKLTRKDKLGDNQDWPCLG